MEAKIKNKTNNNKKNPQLLDLLEPDLCAKSITASFHRKTCTLMC